MTVKDRFVHVDLARRAGAVVPSSARGGEYSYESKTIENGFFTEAVLEALGGKGDADGDQRLDSWELRDFVSQRVTEMTGGRQHPTVDRDNIHARISLPIVAP